MLTVIPQLPFSLTHSSTWPLHCYLNSNTTHEHNSSCAHISSHHLGLPFTSSPGSTALPRLSFLRQVCWPSTTHDLLSLFFISNACRKWPVVPFRDTIVSSTNQIGSTHKFFDNPLPPHVRQEDDPYPIQVGPPVDSRRCRCHSMSETAIDISNRSRKLPGFESIDPNLSMASVFTPPAGDGGVHITPFLPILLENMSVQPVWQHSHHRHCRLQSTSPILLKNVSVRPVHRHSHHPHCRFQKTPFIEKLSHPLVLQPWEGRAIAFSEQTRCQRDYAVLRSNVRS